MMFGKYRRVLVPGRARGRFRAGCVVAAVFGFAFAPIAVAEDALAVAQAAAADAGAKKPEGPWSGNVRLGYLATTGNSETENANFAFGVDYAVGRWVHGLTGSAIGANEDDETTAEAYTLGWRSAYDLSERNYLFGRADWLKDKFSGYDQQFSQSVGYGRRVIMQPHQTLNLEAGGGARQSELRTGDELKETIVRLGAIYEYHFNETAQLNFDLGVEAGEDNTFTQGVLGLKTLLVRNLAVVLAYTVRNNTDVPDDSEKTDTMTSVSVAYLF